MRPDDIDEMIRHYDNDHDGKINFGNFKLIRFNKLNDNKPKPKLDNSNKIFFNIFLIFSFIHRRK